MNMIPFGGNFNGPVTMSSRDIAELCEKRHDNVMADIAKMISDIGLHAPDFSGTYKTAKGNTYECFNLPEDLVVTLITGYRADLRYKVVKELEKLRSAQPQASLPDFTDPGVAARAWAEQFEANKALQIENSAKDAAISAMQPMVDEYEAYLSEEGVCRIMDFCNKHGVKKNHPGYVLRDRNLMHQKKVLATQIGLKSGILKNVLEKSGFEYTDSKGQSVEAQQAMVVRQHEVSLLKMIVDAYGLTAFRNPVAFDRAKNLIGGAA